MSCTSLVDVFTVRRIVNKALPDLVQTRLGHKKLFSLHPRISQLLPFAVTREHQDEVAFAAALEAGRLVILDRRNKRRARRV
jgi:hypothetical protein